jgi:two-component system chemotaxis response regulator CheB
MPGEIVVVGTSRGGLKASQVLLSGLQSNFPVPIIIVQHRGKDESSLCDYLNRTSPLPVSEPEDKELIQPGHVYLAPRDYHLLIEGSGFALSVDAPVAYARPSIDVLFESAADQYKDRTIGVILTGVNSDGAYGLAAIKAHGGLTLVEEPETAAHPEMPEAAIARANPDWILPLNEIAGRLNSLCGSLAVS